MKLAVVFAATMLAGCFGNGNGEPVTPSGPPPEKSLQINEPGKPVDIMKALPDGYVVVVDFWGEHCGACKVVGGMLAIKVAKEPRVLIRKIDVGDGFSEVAEQNDISALPHFKVYDKHKRMRADLIGNQCLEAPRIALALALED